VPLVAGICAMPFVPFQIANVTSALVWAAGILAPGAIGVRWLF
jgi:membrane protein DedA with SNARE-associated domain